MKPKIKLNEDGLDKFMGKATIIILLIIFLI